MTIKDLVPRLGHRREQLAERREANDPFRGLQREMNRLFNDFFDGFPSVLRPSEEYFGVAGFSPRVDLTESDKEVRVTAELPGMDEKDIAVEMDNEAIVIRGEKKEEKHENGKNWHTRELSYGSFHRVIPLPEGADTTKANAKFKKGILTITVTKREEAVPKRKAIAIESE